SLNVTDLALANGRAIDGFFSSNVEAFTAGLADVHRELTKLGLQAAATLALIEEITAFPGVLVAKGCGAMGADTLLAIVDREFRSEFFAAANGRGLTIVAATQDLMPATKLKVS